MTMGGSSVLCLIFIAATCAGAPATEKKDGGIMEVAVKSVEPEPPVMLSLLDPEVANLGDQPASPDLNRHKRHHLKKKHFGGGGYGYGGGYSGGYGGGYGGGYHQQPAKVIVVQVVKGGHYGHGGGGGGYGGGYGGGHGGGYGGGHGYQQQPCYNCGGGGGYSGSSATATATATATANASSYGKKR